MVNVRTAVRRSEVIVHASVFHMRSIVPVVFTELHARLVLIVITPHTRLVLVLIALHIQLTLVSIELRIQLGVASDECYADECYGLASSP